MSEEEELRIIAEAFPPKPKCCGHIDLTEWDRVMREEVIPQIAEDERRAARAAHFMRLGCPDPLVSKEQTHGN